MSIVICCSSFVCCRIFSFLAADSATTTTCYDYDVRQWMPSCLIVSYFCLLHVRGSAAQIFIFPGDEDVMAAMRNFFSVC